jgi:outer membrane protein assembly factor BamB
MKPRGTRWEYVVGVAGVAAALLAPSLATGSDWTRFRGPNGLGVAEVANPPTRLNPPDAVWQTALPAGHSSPVLTADRIFVTGHEDERLLTIALDRSSGRVLWRREAPRPREEALHETNGPASPSPATDGRNVYVFFGDFGLISYGPDGEERWRLPLGPFSIPNGHGSSPILAGDRLVLQVDQDRGSFVMAIDPEDGSVLWRTERPEATHGYSTPVVFSPQGGPEQVILLGSYQVTSYELETGRKRWWSRGPTWQTKSSPTVDDTTVYVSAWAPGADTGERQQLPPFAEAIERGDSDGDGKISEPEAVAGGWRHSGGWGLVDLDDDGRLNEREWEFFRARRSSHNTTLAIRPGARTGDITAEAVRWTYEKAVPVISSPLLYGGLVYTIKDGGILTALDAETGEVAKQGRVRGAVDKYFSSPIVVGGRIYVVSEGGTASVIEPGGDWTVLSSSELGEPCYATPAVGGDTLYVRTAGHLYAFGPSGAE